MLIAFSVDMVDHQEVQCLLAATNADRITLAIVTEDLQLQEPLVQPREAARILCRCLGRALVVPWFGYTSPGIS
jgi:hypothetical protein